MLCHNCIEELGLIKGDFEAYVPCQSCGQMADCYSARSNDFPGYKGDLTPPPLEQLMQWESEGGCESTDGCWVEPDGICEHGCQSWLLELRMI